MSEKLGLAGMLAIVGLWGVYIGAAVLPRAAAAETAVAAEGKEPVIQVTARRYRFEPDHISLKKGVPVVLELRSPETTMSFNAPDFLVSEELPPGKVVRVRLVPDKTGEFVFVCDIYCGSGHEKMRGAIKVD